MKFVILKAQFHSVAFRYYTVRFKKMDSISYISISLTTMET